MQQILEFSNSANPNKHLMPIIVDSPPFLFALLSLLIHSLVFQLYLLFLFLYLFFFLFFFGFTTFILLYLILVFLYSKIRHNGYTGIVFLYFIFRICFIWILFVISISSSSFFNLQKLSISHLTKKKKKNCLSLLLLIVYFFFNSIFNI